MEKRMDETMDAEKFLKELIHRALLGDEQAQKLKLKKVWRGMKERCEHPNHSSYKNYGARGIYVCDSWKYDFDCFYQWAITNGYSIGLSLDRIDNNGNYRSIETVA